MVLQQCPSIRFRGSVHTECDSDRNTDDTVAHTEQMSQQVRNGGGGGGVMSVPSQKRSKLILIKKINKKVLLRERKRHTDLGISSTPSIVLYWGCTPSLVGGVPHPLAGGISPWQEVPLRWTWLGYPPPPRCGLTNKVKI